MSSIAASMTSLSIPTVADLRKAAKMTQAEQRQQRRKQKAGEWAKKKAEMIANRATYRKENWTEERQTEYNEWLEKLKSDFALVVDCFTQFVIDLSRNAMAADKTSFRVWHFQKAETVQEMVDAKGGLTAGVRLSTFFTGFWNKEKRRHNLMEFWEAGINQMVLATVRDRLRPGGFKLNDISDSNKSFAKVLEVSFGEDM